MPRYFRTSNGLPPAGAGAGRDGAAAVWVDGLRTGGRAAGQKWLDDYMACYHKTCDAWDAGWNLTGAAQDVDLFHAIGARLAMAGVWPTWSAGSEFAAIRDRSAGERR